MRKGIGFAWLWCGVTLFASVAWGAQAGGLPIDLDAYGIAPPPMPTVLIKTNAGDITLAAFRARLRKVLVLDGASFHVPEGFMRSVMLGIEARRLKFPVPSAAELASALAEQARQLGGEEKLRAALLEKKMSRGDLARAVHEGLIFEAIIRARNKLPRTQTVSPDLAAKTVPALVKIYQPVFRGIQAKVVATIGGQNFTPDDVVDFSLAWGRDAVLRAHLHTMIQDALIHREAKQRGMDAGTVSTDMLIEMLVARDLAPKQLKQYYRGIAGYFEIVRAQHIFCAFDRRPGHAYKPENVTLAMKTAAHMRATALLVKLRRGRKKFAATARQESDCPTAARGGDLGFLVQAPDMVQSLPPRIWGLDFIRSERGLRSPLAIAPTSEIHRAAFALRDREISSIIETPTGYSIIKRVTTRQPRKADKLLPYIRARRLQELRAALLKKIAAEANVIWLWTPEKRGQNQYP